MSENKILTTINSHFPASKKKWKLYFKIFLPVFLGGIIFSLNGIIDNLMVGHIKGGQEALSVVVAWTGIILGFFAGIATAGTILLSQSYFAKKFTEVEYICKIRFILSLTVGISFFILGWVIPNQLINVFLNKNQITGSLSDYNDIYSQAKRYLRIITFQWLLISLSFNFLAQLNEIGKTKVALAFISTAILINIILNGALLYGFNFGIEATAYSTVTSRFITLIACLIYLNLKEKKLIFNLFSIFKIPKQIWKTFFKKSSYGIMIIFLEFFITLRIRFYDLAYPIGSLGKGVGGLSIVALTSVITSFFLVILNSISVLGSNFVGSEIGKKNIKQALINSNELKGFNIVNSIVLSTILVIIASIVPHMSFLSSSAKVDNVKKLLEVRNASFVIAAFLPFWTWTVSSENHANVAGKGHWFALVVLLIIGPLQIGTLALMTEFLVPKYKIFSNNFTFFYFFFFLTDFLTLIIVECLYYKYPWYKNTIRKSSNKKVTKRQNR